MASHLKAVEFTTPGTTIHTLPAGCTAVLAMVLGAGAGGSGTASYGSNGNAGGGGGGGEFCEAKLVPCPAGTATVVVGARGTGGPRDTRGFPGGNSSVNGVCIAQGGFSDAAIVWGGDGGGPGGRLTQSLGGQPPFMGARETPSGTGGAGGGEGAFGATGYDGAGYPGTTARSLKGIPGAGSNRGGGGGANSPYGAGGNGGNDSTASLPGQPGDPTTIPGAGGGGGAGNEGVAGGDGGPGRVILFYPQ